MKPRRALVTGATGFVGSHLVGQLLADQWTVHVLARPESRLDPLSASLGRLVVHRFDGGIDGMADIVRQARPDVVFHLASRFVAEHQAADVPRLIESNLLLGCLLVEAMSLQEVRYLVNAGTSWQHYQGREFDPVNLYAATKQAFEALLGYYVAARDMRVITLKLFDTYGKDDPRPKLMGLLLNAARTNQPLGLTPGEQRIDLVHVDDAARAFLVAGERLLEGKVGGSEQYAVSSGQAITPRDLVDRINAIIGRDLPVSWGQRPYRDREVMVPWTGETLAGWRPRVALSEGLREIFGSC